VLRQRLIQRRRAAVVQEVRGEPQGDQRLGPELGRRREAEADVREVGPCRAAADR